MASLHSGEIERQIKQSIDCGVSRTGLSIIGNFSGGFQ
jgi:hypothetical protein